MYFFRDFVKELKIELVTSHKAKQAYIEKEKLENNTLPRTGKLVPTKKKMDNTLPRTGKPLLPSKKIEDEESMSSVES